MASSSKLLGHARQWRVCYLISCTLRVRPTKSVLTQQAIARVLMAATVEPKRKKSSGGFFARTPGALRVSHLPKKLNIKLLDTTIVVTAIVSKVKSNGA